MDVKRGMSGRRRRRHSEEFKSKVIAECRRPGVSIASVALANGLNANLLRLWVSRAEQQGGEVAAPPEAPAQEAFIELPLVDGPSPVSGGDIRIELRRGATTVAISWPAASAQECAAWLRSWLR